MGKVPAKGVVRVGGKPADKFVPYPGNAVGSPVNEFVYDDNTDELFVYVKMGVVDPYERTGMDMGSGVCMKARLGEANSVWENALSYVRLLVRGVAGCMNCGGTGVVGRT